MKKNSLALLLLLGGHSVFAQVAAPARKAPARQATVSKLLQASKAPATVDSPKPSASTSCCAEYTADRRDTGNVLWPLSEPTANGSIPRVPGAIALVMRDGKVVYRKSLGVDDMFTTNAAPHRRHFPHCLPDQSHHQHWPDAAV